MPCPADQSKKELGGEDDTAAMRRFWAWATIFRKTTMKNGPQIMLWYHKMGETHGYRVSVYLPDKNAMR